MAGLRKRILVFVLTVQSILFLGHWFVYQTWAGFWALPILSTRRAWRVALALLSVSFVAASLLGHRYSNLQ